MRKFVSIISIAAMVLAAGACKKQDPPDNDFGKMSDLEYLISGMVKVDANGYIVGYNIGDNLNEANPWEISVPVNNFEEALELFKGIIPEDAVLIQKGNSVTWDMTGGDGKAEGTAVLKKNGEQGAVATLTVTPLLQTKGPGIAPSVIFLPAGTWPGKAGAAEEILAKDYYLGASVYKKKDDGFGKGEFLVIRPWSPQQAGIMAQMVPGTTRNKGQFSSMNTLHQVQKAMAANYDLLVEGYGKKHGWPDLDSCFYSGDLSSSGCVGYCNLETGKEEWVHVLWPRPKKEGTALVYLFRPDGDKIKYW